eukprot:PhM_4_TR14041/c0_g1_i1/m.6317
MSCPCIHANAIPHCNNLVDRYPDSTIYTHADADTEHFDQPDAEFDIHTHIRRHAISNIDADTEHFEQPDAEFDVHTDNLTLRRHAVSNNLTLRRHAISN